MDQDKDYLAYKPLKTDTSIWDFILFIAKKNTYQILIIYNPIMSLRLYVMFWTDWFFSFASY